MYPSREQSHPDKLWCNWPGEMGEIPGRRMSPLIEGNPVVAMGEPLIDGTRLTLEDILEKLGLCDS